MLKALRAFALLLLLTGTTLLPQQANATHFVGSELSYEAIPGLPGFYLISLKLYRDCGGATFGTTFDVSINSSCGTMPDLTLTLNQLTDVSGVCVGTPTECTGGGTAPGIEEYIYTGLINMSTAPPCANWTFSFTNCCRNNDIKNLSNPGGDDFYTEAILNTGTSALPIVNTSPKFSASITAAPYICSGDTLTYNPGVFDTENDSLVFSLATALGGQAPNPITLGYVNGFSPQQPFGINTGYPTTINPSSGEIKYVAPIIPVGTTQTYAYVIVIKIEEYRKINGVSTLIGTSQRDVQVQVLSCTSPPPQPDPITVLPEGTIFQVEDSIEVRACQTAFVNIPFRISSPNLSLSITSNRADVPVFINSTETITVDTLPGGAKIYTYIFTWSPGPDLIRDEPYQLILEVTNGVCPIPGYLNATRNILVTQAKLETDVYPDTVCLGQAITITSALDSSIEESKYDFSWAIVPPIGKTWPIDSVLYRSFAQSIFINTSLNDTALVMINQSALDSAGYGQVTELKLIGKAQLKPDSITKTGCYATDTLTIPIATPIIGSFYYYDKPLDFTKDLVKSGPPVEVFFRNTTDTTEVSSYVWTFTDGDSIYTNDSVSNPSFVYTKSGTYPVTLEITDQVAPDSNGFNTCTYSITRMITIPPVISPNVITPNGDGENDMFRVGARRPGSTITIFNRWGKRMAEVSASEEGWAPGEKITTGIYYFLYEEPDTKVIQKGWIDVIR